MNLGNQKLRAVTGFVLIESQEHEASETKTKSGIVLIHKEKHNIWVEGTIYSAGTYMDFKTKQVQDAPVKEGDRILYRKYEGEKILFDDKVLYRLPYERVRFTLED